MNFCKDCFHYLNAPCGDIFTWYRCYCQELFPPPNRVSGNQVEWVNAVRVRDAQKADECPEWRAKS